MINSEHQQELELEQESQPLNVKRTGTRVREPAFELGPLELTFGPSVCRRLGMTVTTIFESDGDNPGR